MRGAIVSLFGLSAYCFWRNQQKISAKYHSLKQQQLGDMILPICIMGAMTIPAYYQLGETFTEWDAVVSWNRWGIELSDNAYKPLTAAYPILWPAIWSLIYEAQGTADVWFFSRASIIFPIFFIGVFVAGRTKSEAPISGVLLAFLIMFCLLAQPKALNGYMDGPATLLGIVGMLIAVQSTTIQDYGKRRQFLIVAAISLGLAMLSKQQAFLFGLIFGCFVLIEVARGRTKFMDGILLAALMILPTLSFFGIYLERMPNIFDNSENLARHASTIRGDTPPNIYAATLLWKSLPWSAWVLLVLGNTLNLIFTRNIRALIAFAYLGSAIGYFFYFAHCCAYALRNGFVIYGLLIVGAYIGFVSAEKYLRANINFGPAQKQLENRYFWAIPYVLVLIFCIGFFHIAPGKELVVANNKIKSEEIGNPRISWFLKKIVKKFLNQMRWFRISLL